MFQVTIDVAAVQFVFYIKILTKFSHYFVRIVTKVGSFNYAKCIKKLPSAAPYYLRRKILIRCINNSPLLDGAE